MPEQSVHHQQRAGQIALLKKTCFHCSAPLETHTCGSLQPVGWTLWYGGWPTGAIVLLGSSGLASVKIPAIVACFGGTQKMFVYEERLQEILGGVQQ